MMSQCGVRPTQILILNQFVMHLSLLKQAGEKCPLASSRQPHAHVRSWSPKIGSIAAAHPSADAAHVACAGPSPDETTLACLTQLRKPDVERWECGTDHGEMSPHKGMTAVHLKSTFMTGSGISSFSRIR